jgi:hypothetical protein
VLTYLTAKVRERKGNANPVIGREGPYGCETSRLGSQIFFF